MKPIINKLRLGLLLASTIYLVTCKPDNKSTKGNTNDKNSIAKGKSDNPPNIDSGRKQSTEIKLAPTQFNYTMNPGKSAGIINIFFTRAKLDSVYGKANVSNRLVQVDGKPMTVTVLFAGTTAEAEIVWSDTIYQKYPVRLRIKNENSIWKFSDGIKIGTSIEELVKLNAQDIHLYGFGWEFGGLIADWRGGNLDKDYQAKVKTNIFLAQQGKTSIDEATKKHIYTQQRLNSNDPTLKLLNLKVSIIDFFFM
ncbi:MAG: hypothetical protein SGJ04_03695 [Bacteroidota bacterium]|nr:hypothetical protein [Bacteroidota bacterium]